MKKAFSIFFILVLIICYKYDIYQRVINGYNLNKNPVSKRINKDYEENIDKFSNIKIGDSKDTVINKLGKPERIDKSEYLFNWYVYKNNKEKLVMIGIENDKVVSLFTNSINSIESENIDINNDINYIRKNFEVLKYKIKGNIKYKIISNDEYDIIYINKKYITVFYDKHNDNKIWAYEIISYSSENEVDNIYPKKDKNIEESFMKEIIDLTNCTRYVNDLPPLKYDEKATICATKHSKDMRDNKYFDHNNLNEETPFDRMKKEGIYYTSAGENIAAGQSNSVFVHNGWLNSLGHRKNILGNYKYIGIGIVFGGNYNTYYTENFFG